MSEEERQQLEELFGSKLSNPLADKASLEYNEAYNEGAILEDERKTQVDPLISSLEQAEHLSIDKRERLVDIGNKYLSDMRENIFCDQFDLHEKYKSITIDEWNDFLADRIVSTYIGKHKRTLLKNKAESNLATPSGKNKRDNLQLLRELEEKDKNENNTNIVIMRIPDIYARED